jgi:hypothetical protein
LCSSCLKSVCLLHPLPATRPTFIVVLCPSLPRTVSKRLKSSQATRFPAENRGSRGPIENLKLCQSTANRCQTGLKSLTFETPGHQREHVSRTVSAHSSDAYTDSRLGGLWQCAKWHSPTFARTVCQRSLSIRERLRKGKFHPTAKTTPCHSSRNCYTALVT